MVCNKCQKAFKDGDSCIEIVRGSIEDTGVKCSELSVKSIETEALLCVDCEGEVLPALWADINEVTKEGRDNFECPKHSA